ncbi:probable RNA-binding protein 46 [Cryptotermes secundus]|uniref:probable RNA-binding protein 46 n=1 Tax=Cryptotermes secundus TaxID=105785 RepID=UPI000CD7DCC8|nr:probable RNA-binding protein 46 [Cryptotermes secundus]
MESSIENVNEENRPALITTPDTRTIDNNVFTKMSANILEFLRKTGYTLVQKNGQRRLGGPPPKWEGPPPPKGSEVFVGKIPRNCFEDELVPVFEEVGKIYELRLMMDFSGSNRGFGFVTYSSPEVATRAVEKLNNREIRLGMRIGVVKSVNNCKLFISGIPSGESESDIRRVLCLVTEGVVEVRLIKKTGYGGMNRSTNSNVQNAIVEYDSHCSAALARRRLIPNREKLWGRNTIVDWAKPQSCSKSHQRKAILSARCSEVE